MPGSPYSRRAALTFAVFDGGLPHQRPGAREPLRVQRVLFDPAVHAVQLEADGGGGIGHFGNGRPTVAIPPELGCRAVPCEIENSKFDLCTAVTIRSAPRFQQVQVPLIVRGRRCPEIDLVRAFGVLEDPVAYPLV